MMFFLWLEKEMGRVFMGSYMCKLHIQLRHLHFVEATAAEPCHCSSSVIFMAKMGGPQNLVPFLLIPFRECVRVVYIN